MSEQNSDEIISKGKKRIVLILATVYFIFQFIIVFGVYVLLVPFEGNTLFLSSIMLDTILSFFLSLLLSLASTIITAMNFGFIGAIVSLLRREMN